MSWRWRTRSDGLVEVDKGQGFAVPVLLDYAGRAGRLDKVLQWRSLAEKYGKKYGVPVSWVLGVIYSESGGDPSAHNFKPGQASCCAGLMAIYLAVHKKTLAAMLDPEQNIDYGVSLLAHSRKLGLQLPEAASCHVSGCGTSGFPHPSSTNPWGMREHSWVDKPDVDGSIGYIDRVVRASNTFADMLGARAGASLTGGAAPGLFALTLGLVGGFWAAQRIAPRVFA